MYVGKPRTNTCLGQDIHILEQVLDISQDGSSQDSRTVKL